MHGAVLIQEVVLLRKIMELDSDIMEIESKLKRLYREYVIPIKS